MTEKRFITMWKPETTFSRFWIARDNWDKKLNANDVVDLLNGQHEELKNRKRIIKSITNDYNELEQAYSDAKSDVERYEQILKGIMEDNLLIQDMKKELGND